MPRLEPGPAGSHYAVADIGVGREVRSDSWHRLEWAVIGMVERDGPSPCPRVCAATLDLLLRLAIAGNKGDVAGLVVTDVREVTGTPWRRQLDDPGRLNPAFGQCFVLGIGRFD